jgi:tetratricopeptide (TPR) repeat protein
MKKKQIVVIVVVLIIMGYLWNLPVQGLVRPKEARTSRPVTMAQAKPVTQVDLTAVTASAKAAIGPNLSVKINDLEDALKKAATDDEKLKLQLQLAKSWDDVNQAAPAAFYYLDIARKKNDLSDWLNAGSRFNDAYKLTQDTSLQPAYVNNAVESFQHALKLNADNLDAQTGLGVAYVNGGAPSPMQGIALLLGVVKKDPNNVNANLNLGLFAMKSGQFEKAVTRFKTVIDQKPKSLLEPYFYLAESYKQLGMKKEAIAAYQRCKEMMPDPAFDQRIDQFIKELKD